MQWGQRAWGCRFLRRNQPSDRVVGAVAVAAAHEEEAEDKAEAGGLGSAGGGGLGGAVHQRAWGVEEGRRAFLKAKRSAGAWPWLHVLLCAEHWEEGVVGVSSILFVI